MAAGGRSPYRTKAPRAPDEDGERPPADRFTAVVLLSALACSIVRFASCLARPERAGADAVLALVASGLATHYLLRLRAR